MQYYNEKYSLNMSMFVPLHFVFLYDTLSNLTTYLTTPLHLIFLYYTLSTLKLAKLFLRSRYGYVLGLYKIKYNLAHMLIIKKTIFFIKQKYLISACTVCQSNHVYCTLKCLIQYGVQTNQFMYVTLISLFLFLNINE